MGGNIIEDHGACAGQKSRFQFRRVANGFDREIQRGECLRHRIVLIAGGQHDARATGDFDPAGGAVVARVGVIFRADLGLVFEAPRAGEAVGEFHGGLAVDEGDRGLCENLAIAAEDQRESRISRASNRDRNQKWLADLDPLGKPDSRDAEVVLGFLADQAEVQRDAPRLHLCGGFLQRFGRVAVCK